jgi:hypothetical protein
MWHKAWAQSSQGVTGRPHHLGRLTMCWRISKNLLSTCPEEVVLKVSNAQRRCKGETWLLGQVAWSASLTSGPHVTNLRPEHRLTPPINTTMLPPAESVKKVRFSPHKGFQIHSL